MATLRDVITRWGFDVDFSELDKMEAQTKKIRAGFVKVGAIATTALAGLIVPAASLEDTLRKSAAAAGKQGADFDKTLAKLGQRSLILAEELGISSKEIGAGFFNVISTGLDPLSKEFDEFSSVAFKLAKVTGGDVGEAVSQLNTTLVSFRDKGETASSIADKMAKANTLADTSVTQLAGALRIAAPLASGVFGASLNTTTAVLAGFADAGFKAENGGEALKQVMNKLSAPTGAAAAAIEKLGVKTTNSDGTFKNIIDIVGQFEGSLDGYTQSAQAAALKTIFGEETVGKFAAVLKIGSSTLRGYETALGDSDGALDKTLEQMSGLLDVAKKLFQSIKGVAIRFGSPLLSPLTKVTKAMLAVGKAFNAMLDRNPAIVDALGKVTGGVLAFVAVASGLGIVITTVKLLGAAFTKMGTKAFVAGLKTVALPVLILAGAAALLVLLNDLTTFFTGQDSFIGRLIETNKKYATSIQLIGLSFGLLAIAAGAALFPITTIVVLFGLIALTIFNTRKEWGLFFDLIANTTLGGIVEEFGEWLLSLVGVQVELKALGALIDKLDIADKLIGIAEAIPGIGGFIKLGRLALTDDDKKTKPPGAGKPGTGKPGTGKPGVGKPGASALPDFLSPLGGFNAPAVSPVNAQAAAGGSTSSVKGDTNVTANITVNGADDAAATARAVKQVLTEELVAADDGLIAE